jgi:hypothetical protein
MNTQLPKDRENSVQLAVPNHGFPADQGNMNGTMFPHESEHTFDERISAKVAQLPQRNASGEMVLAVGVAARAVEWTLPRDLDR